MIKLTRFYIVYGSNLNVRQMKIRCPKARLVGTATLENHILYFRGSLTGSYLTIEPKIGASVPVAVWEVTPSDENTLSKSKACGNSDFGKSHTLFQRKSYGFVLNHRAENRSKRSCCRLGSNTF